MSVKKESVKNRCLIAASFLSFMFAFVFSMGLYVSRMYFTSFYPMNYPYTLLEYFIFGLIHILILFPLFFGLLMILSKNENNIEAGTNNGKFSSKIYFLSAGIVLGVYMVVLYACYPGFFNYDVGGQITSVLYDEVPYSAAHPLFHTLLMGGLMKIGYILKPESLKFGIFMYTAFQATVCACSFALALEYIYRISRSKILFFASLLFYCFCPAILFLSLSTTKDALCCSSLLVGSLLLYQLYIQKKSSWKKWAICGMCFVLACLLRVNVIGIVALFAIASIVLVSENRKKQIILFISVIILYFGINKGLEISLQASSNSSIELYSVPLQQIARLYVEEGPEVFSNEELELLYKVSCVEGKIELTAYSPFLSDMVKYSFKQNENAFKDNLKDFLLLWIKKGVQYPKVYFMALCANTYQAWYPGTFVYSAYGYNYFEKGSTDECYSKPKINPVYDWITYMFGNSDECGYKDVFGLRVLVSMGTYFCLMIFTAFLSFVRKNKKQLAIVMLLIIACGMYLVGPLSSIRYYLILFDFVPIMCFFIFGKLRK